MPPEAAQSVIDATSAVIRRAADLLQRGEAVVIPTDTVYGVAARADMPEALERVYQMKGRDTGKPVALLVPSLAAAQRAGAQTSGAVERLAAAFWPGALTLVLPTAAGGWTGYRVPDHPVTLAVLQEVDAPLAVTSANQSGAPPALTAQAAWDALQPHPALVLDGGPVSGGVASTVIRVETERLLLLREGPIPPADLARVSALPVE